MAPEVITVEKWDSLVSSLSYPVSLFALLVTEILGNESSICSLRSLGVRRRITLMTSWNSVTGGTRRWLMWFIST